MIVTFFRSSSFNTYDFCGMQYFIGYSLGLPNPSMTIKADAGNIVHKALELLGAKKLAIQNGLAEFSNKEIGKTWAVNDFDEELAFHEAWEVYTTKLATNWDWRPTKKANWHTKCHDWMWECLRLNNGMWNPMNRDIIQPEQYFDFVIEEEWAKYNYIMPDGKKEVGYLGLKGTVDLITKVDDNTIEYLDWKTGMRKDWVTGKQKDWKKLRDDPQLRIYHYALSRLYPQYDHIIMTIVFVQDGGAFSLDFSKDDLKKTEDILKSRFNKVRDCERPNRIISNGYHKWKCSRLCYQGMTNYVDEQGRDTGKTICDHMHSEIITLGMDKVYKKYGTKDGNKYGSGGGVSNREGNKNEPKT